jgi:HEAT repeat protein
VNGILGLYYSKDEAFYGKMLDLAQHVGPNFRLSLAWALGQIRDQRAFSMLRGLQQDDSCEVRSKAAASLAALASAEGSAASISAAR